MAAPDAPAVRRADASDAIAVATLLHAFNSEYEEATPGVEALAGHARDLLGTGEIAVLLSGTGPDGFCLLRFHRSIYDGRPDAHLQELYVTPDRRRRGIGRALLEAAIELARDSGASHIDLNTGESDVEARSLYASVGFTNREGRPDGPPMLYYELDL